MLTDLDVSMTSLKDENPLVPWTGVGGRAAFRDLIRRSSSETSFDPPASASVLSTEAAPFESGSMCMAPMS